MAKPRDLNRRQLILDTALKLFSDRGYYGVSVNDIAKAADISTGSMYTYFVSKDVLVNELYRYWKQRFGEVISRDLEPLSGRDAHKRLWFNLQDFMREHPLPFLFLEAQHHASYLDDESNAMGDGTRAYAIDLFRQRFGLEVSNEHAQLVLSFSFGAHVQVFKDAHLGRIDLSAQTCDRLEDLAWQALAAPPYEV